MKRVAVWAVLLVSALFLLTTGGTYPGIASVEAHIIGQVIAYVVLGGWCLVALFRPEWRPNTPLLLPIALATGAYLLSFVFSQRPRLSLEPTLAGVGWAVGYLFLSRLLAEPWFRARVRALLIAFTAIVAVGYIVQVVVEWIRWWNLIGFIAVPPLRPSFAGLWFGSPNLVATTLILTTPLSIVLLIEESRRRWLGPALFAASLVAVLLSGSRGAWLGVAVGLVAVLALLAGRHGPSALMRPVAQVLQRRRAQLGAIAMLALLGVAFVPSVLRRLAVGGEDVRFDLWRAALSIFAEHPLTGAGPGTWVQLKVASNPSGSPNLIVPHAHDMYVQAAAEVGLVGLGCLLLLVGSVIVRLVKDPSAGRSASLAGPAVFCALAALAGQSTVDNLVNLPFVCLLLTVLVAWVDGGNVPNRPFGAGSRIRKGLLSPAIPVALLLGLGVLTPLLVRLDAAALADVRGNEYATRGAWAAALADYESASSLDPGFTLYELQLASAYGRLGRLEEARSVAVAAIADDPLGMHQVGLASIVAQLGDLRGALTLAKAAILSAPGDPAVALNAGIIGELARDPTFVTDAFGQAIAAAPSLAGDTFFDSPVRLLDKDGAVAAARALSDPASAALVLAYAGDPYGAMIELGAQPPDSRRDTYLAAADWLAGDPAGALGGLEQRLLANPQDWFAAAWAARIAYAIGETSLADRYAEWARIVQADTAPGVMADVGVLSATPERGSESLPRNYPWAVYLRPTSMGLAIGEIVPVGAR